MSTKTAPRAPSGLSRWSSMGRSPSASSARSAAAAFVAASSSSRPATTTMRRSKSCSWSQPPRLMSRGYRAAVPRALLPGRRVRERQLGVTRLVDLDHQRHSALMAPHRERLPDVLVRHGIHDLEVRVGTPLHHATAELHLLVRVVEVHDRQGDPGIAACVAPLHRPLTRAHQEPIALAPYPDGYAVG